MTMLTVAALLPRSTPKIRRDATQHTPERVAPETAVAVVLLLPLKTQVAKTQVAKKKIAETKGQSGKQRQRQIHRHHPIGHIHNFTDAQVAADATK